MGSVASSTDELDDRLRETSAHKMQLPQPSSAHDRLAPSPSLLHAGSQVRGAAADLHLIFAISSLSPCVVSPTVVFHNSGTDVDIADAGVALFVCAHGCPGHGVLSSSGTAVAFRVRCGRQARLLFSAGHTCQGAAKGGVRRYLRAAAAAKLFFSPLVPVSMMLVQRW